MRRSATASAVSDMADGSARGGAHGPSGKLAVPRPTFRSIWRTRRQGMTLIEILIVTALIAVVMTLGAFSLGLIGRNTAQSEALRISGLVRYIYNASANQNRTLQWIINLEDGTFYVDELDVAGAMSLEDIRGDSLRTADDDEDDDMASFRKDGLGPVDEEDAVFGGINRERSNVRVLDEDESKLAEGVYFLGIMTSHHESLQTDGLATVNFFPNGFVERTVIYLGDEDAKLGEPEDGITFTLLINSLTGHTTIKPGMIELDDRFFDIEEDD